MNKVPDMISTKDLLSISDAFEWNLTAHKKANHYAEVTVDKEIKKEMENVSNMHLKVCEDLLKLLGG